MSIVVKIPSPLFSYTKSVNEVDIGEAGSVADALGKLDARYPGLKFRIIDEQDGIRTHIKLYVDRKQIDNIGTQLQGNEIIHIICALSGG